MLILVVILLIISFFLNFFIGLKILRKNIFILDKTVLIDTNFLKILENPIFTNQNLEIIIPKFVVEHFEEFLKSKNIIDFEMGNAALENVNFLEQNKNLEFKIVGVNRENLLPQDAQILSLAKKYKAKILTNDFELYLKAKLSNVKIINLGRIKELFQEKIKLGDILSVYLFSREGNFVISYFHDGTKVLVEDAKDYLHKKILCKIYKISKNLDEGRIFAKFMKIDD